MAACPGCSHALEPRTLESHHGRTVTVDVCAACHGFWFDGYELMQLSAGATRQLFRDLTAAPMSAPGIVDRKRCPRCGARLARTTDRLQDTTFESHRCPNRCGRYMSFAAFLRSKRFVRDLTPAEVAKLRESVRFARCPSCGANVDLRLDGACTYCRAPLAILDPDQIEKALAMLHEQDSATRRVDPSWPLDAQRARLDAERLFAPDDNSARLTGALLDVSVAGVRSLLARLGNRD